MSNRERIIEAAKRLFNEQGVMNTGTNKIAAHMGISPGNLYYHFANKEEIIRAIFPEISEATNKALLLGSNKQGSEEYLPQVLQNWMQVVWEYRFFYGNLVELLRNDPELKQLYIQRREATLQFLQFTINSQIKADKSMVTISGEDNNSLLATNLWIIALNWIRYLQITKSDAEITKQDVARGAIHIIAMLAPYLENETIEEFKRSI
jgi:AcrR family transcriptional regulator